MDRMFELLAVDVARIVADMSLGIALLISATAGVVIVAYHRL